MTETQIAGGQMQNVARARNELQRMADAFEQVHGDTMFRRRLHELANQMFDNADEVYKALLSMNAERPTKKKKARGS